MNGGEAHRPENQTTLLCLRTGPLDNPTLPLVDKQVVLIVTTMWVHISHIHGLCASGIFGQADFAAKVV